MYAKRSLYIQILIQFIDYLPQPTHDLLASTSPYYRTISGSHQSLDWHLLFDDLITASDCTFLSYLDRISIDKHPRNIISQFYDSVIPNISSSSLNEDDFSVLFKVVKILTNPVGYTAEFVNMLGKTLYILLSFSPFITPFVASALYRLYYCHSNYNYIHRLKDLIFLAEGSLLYTTIDTINLLYAFGHQVVYPRFFHVYNQLFNTRYQLRIDPKNVSNLSLLNLQLHSSYPFLEIDISNFDPSNYRLWPLSLAIPNYHSALKELFPDLSFPSSHPEYLIDILLSQPKCSLVKQSTLLSSPIDEISSLVKQFV